MMSVLFLVLFASVVLNVTSQLNYKRPTSAHDLELYQNSIIRDSERLQNHRFDVQPLSALTKQYSFSPKRGADSVLEYKTPVSSAYGPVTQSSKRPNHNYASYKEFDKPESFKYPVKDYALYNSSTKVPEATIKPTATTTQENCDLTEKDDDTSFATSGKGYGNSKALDKSSYGYNSYGYGNSVSSHTYHHHVKPFLDFSPLFLALVPICLTIGAAAAFALASVISNNNINNNNNNLQQQTQQGQQQQQQLAFTYPYFILYNTTLQGISITGKK